MRAGVLYSENFDPVNAGDWTTTSTVGVRGAGIAGFDTGNAMHFAGFGLRTATLRPLDLTTAQTLRFDFRGGNEDIDGDVFWEDVDPGENAVVEYSVNGTSWNLLGDLDLVQFRDDSPVTNWLQFTVELPAAAQTASTQVRWRQVNHSGWRYDEWAIDNIVIATPEPSMPILFSIVAVAACLVRPRRSRLL